MMQATNRDRMSGICAAIAFMLLVLGSVGAVFVNYAMADPPADQDYTGSKVCASCHFEEYMTWKKTKHALAFEALPAKYKTDTKCLQCHTTGFGKPTGYKDDSTPTLAGMTCEVCHGAGSEHAKIAEKYKNAKELTEEQQQEVKGAIWLITPGNVCVKCHNLQSHKVHEKYDAE